MYITGSVVMNASNFTGNSALLGEGGAVQADGCNANVTFTDSMFSYNSAPSCGVNERYHVINFDECSFTHNRAIGEEIGGGVCCVRSASVSYTHLTLPTIYSV